MLKNKLPVFLRDTREHANHGWQFNKTKECDGTIEKKLNYGDYSIEGFEDSVVIERKGSPGELINNLFSPDKDRFIRELENLSKFKRAWVLCEFSISDVAAHLNMLYKIRRIGLYVTVEKFLGYIASLTIKYNVNFVFAGKLYAKEYAKKLLLKSCKYG